MGQSMGTLEFFLLEAGEYLERLDALVQIPSGTFTGVEEFLRVARAFRGSAIMANQHGMARAAQGVESCARALREGRLPWTDGARAELVRAVDDCKVLMHRLRTPEQGDTDRAEAIGVRLDRLSGRASAALRASTGPGLDAGGRAFVAREAAAIASVLQQAARALRAEPRTRDALGGIGTAMSALRGVAILSDLPPLGDVLAAVESVVKELGPAPGAVPPETPEVFEAGAHALARAAREVVDAGRPNAESADARGFADRLLSLLAGVVPVERLFFDDAGPHIVLAGRRPAGAQGLARVDMLSHGEYLTQAATELGRAASAVQCDLRLFSMAANLRSLTAAGEGPLASTLGDFAVAARDAIGRGAASASAADFARVVREAADALLTAQTGDERVLAERLAASARALAGLEVAPAVAPAVAAAPAAPSAPAARAAAVAPPQPPVAPAAVSPPLAAAPAPLAPAASVLGEADLATSYLTLEQLIADRGLPLGTLEELVAGAAAQVAGPDARPVVPVEMLAPDEPEAVPVETLLYGGEAALRRVLELQPELLAAAQAPDGQARLQLLLREVLDLVELGLVAGR